MVAENPFDPLPSGYRWVPHPPLFWYMLSPLRGVPRLPVLLTSAVCLLSTYWASKKLYGGFMELRVHQKTFNGG